MVPEITLNRPQLQALRQIPKVAPEELVQIVEAATKSNWISPKEFEAACTGVLLDEERSTALVRVCFLVRSMSRGVQADADEVLSSIGLALGRTDQEDSEGIALAFSQRKSILLELVRTESVRRISKALDLAYEYGNLYRSSRIITDIRPIYDKDAISITGAIVSYTLKLVYNSLDGQHAITIAMDHEDIDAIAKQCERALSKSKIARDYMQNPSSGVRTIIAGGDQ